MSDPWLGWIHEVVSEVEDDPFVALLKQRLAAGERVVRMSIESGDFAALPIYQVVLLRGTTLSELRLPHSDSLARWSFEVGTRMESAEQEAWRFDALLSQKLAPIARELGKGYFRSLLFEVIRRLAPPRATALIAQEHRYPANESVAEYKQRLRLQGELADLARRLVVDLRYGEGEGAAILDRALERNVDKAFNVRDPAEVRES
jgi:hypothetical protein